MDSIKAPFSPEQIEKLNTYQKSSGFHPFTCGKNRTDEKHLDGEGVLVATENGWICPYCDYKQDWAHEFMAQPFMPIQTQMNALLQEQIKEKIIEETLRKVWMEIEEDLVIINSSNFIHITEGNKKGYNDAMRDVKIIIKTQFGIDL